MRKALAVAAACGVLVVAASADPVTSFSAYGGYFSSFSFTNKYGFATHLGGFEFGGEDALISLPIFGSVSVGGSILFGDSIGGGATGNLYRAHIDYRTAVAPGVKLYAIGGMAYDYATGSSFKVHNGLGLEVGVGVPLKLGIPVGATALEARYRMGDSVTSGFSVGLNVSF
jgi:hypothetical protein